MTGSVYPQGLKGNDIILEAKILMVADVVDAMMSHHPYRAAQEIEVALNEIVANKNKFYDAEAVDSCVKLFVEKGLTFDNDF